MSRIHRLVRVALATAAFVATASASAQDAGAAHNGNWQLEIGVSRISGGQVESDHNGGPASHDGAFDLSAGYRFDNGLGVRALYIGAFDPFKSFLVADDRRSFDDFWGVQAVGYLPVANKLNLMGGLGIGRTSLNSGVIGDHGDKTDGIVSAGLEWRPGVHFSLGWHLDYLTSTKERNFSVMAQFPF